MNTTTTKPTQAVETAQFTYTREGQLETSIDSDGHETHLCYYPAKAAKDNPSRGNAAPVLDSLISGLTLEEGTALNDAVTLTCPQIPDPVTLPLLAKYQCQRFADGSVMPVSLSLYGYAQARFSAPALLEPDTVLVIEGIQVDTSKTPWVVSKTEGRDGLLITLTQSSQTTESTLQTQTVWYKDNDHRQSRTLRETRQADHAAKTLLVEKNLKANGRESVLSRQLLSAYSGRVLREAMADEEGDPTGMRWYGYDTRGREAQVSDIVAMDETAFQAWPTLEPATAGLTVQYNETGSGTWVTLVPSEPSEPKRRILYDGLQRPVRYQLGSATGEHYCTLQELTYGADGEVASQRLYDYLPGGMCQLLQDGELSDEVKALFRYNEPESKPLPSAVPTPGERNSGPSPAQENHANGEVTLTYGGGEASSPVRERTYSRFGQPIRLKETVAGQQSAREWNIDYDELHRRIRLTSPDGSVVRWRYDGLSDVPSRVSVSKGEGTNKRTYVLGSQRLRNGESATLVRGGDGSPYVWRSSAVGGLAPDNTWLYGQPSEDGKSVVWYAKRPDEKGEPSVSEVATFDYDPVAQAVSANSGKNIRVEAQASGVLQLCQLTRVIHGAAQHYALQRSLRGRAHSQLHANGVASHARHNRHGQRARVRRGGLDYLYRYDDQGRCVQLKVLDARRGHELRVEHGFNAAGQEERCDYWLDGVLKSRYQLAWSAAGQLERKALFRDGAATASRTESFEYDALRGWLVKWSVTAEAGDEVKDVQGRALKQQTYAYDVLDNLTECSSTFADGKRETLGYQYHANYPTLRTKVVITGVDKKVREVTLAYDANANQTGDEQGHALTYDARGQLSTVHDKNGTLLCTYEYDERGLLAAQWDEASKTRRVLLYSDALLTGDVLLDHSGKEVCRRAFDEEAGLVGVRREGGRDTVLFLLADPQNGGGDELERGADGHWTMRRMNFTPWGEAPLASLGALKTGTGYNGQRFDPITGAYHLGNGYRAYQPQARGFIQPDNWAPFGPAGLNDRAYCGGDPVNRLDPSGGLMISRRGAEDEMATLDQMIRDTQPPVHESPPWWKWALTAAALVAAVIGTVLTFGAGAVMFGLACAALIVSAVSAGLGFASLALETTNPRQAAALDKASFWTGVAGMFLDLPNTFAAAAKAAASDLAALARQLRAGANRVLAQVKKASKLFSGVSTGARQTAKAMATGRGVFAASTLGQDLITGFANLGQRTRAGIQSLYKTAAKPGISVTSVASPVHRTMVNQRVDTLLTSLSELRGSVNRFDRQAERIGAALNASGASTEGKGASKLLDKVKQSLGELPKLCDDLSSRLNQLKSGTTATQVDKAQSGLVAWFKANKDTFDEQLCAVGWMLNMAPSEMLIASEGDVEELDLSAFDEMSRDMAHLSEFFSTTTRKIAPLPKASRSTQWSNEAMGPVALPGGGTFLASDDTETLPFAGCIARRHQEDAATRLADKRYFRPGCDLVAQDAALGEETQRWMGNAA